MTGPRPPRPSRPPRWARRIVEALVSGREREFVLGDLEEAYSRRLGRGDPGGRRAALFAYLVQGVRSGLRDRMRDASAGLGGDLRSALRQFRAHPRVHVVGSLVLAVGLGVATATWGFHHGIFGRGLPVSEPDRVMGLLLMETDTREVRSSFSHADLETIRASAPALDGAALWGWSRVTLADGTTTPARLEALQVSPSMFGLLELAPLHGRLLVASDASAGAPPVAVLSHPFWVRRYHGDPGVVGRSVRIDGRPATVVGVLPPDAYIQDEDVWLPAGAAHGAGFDLLARAAPGRSPDEVTATLRGLGPRLATHDPERPADVELRALPFPASLYQEGPSDVHLAVRIRAGALLFVMALANAAGLFLVRARVRSRELAVRRALGAGRFRVMRQLFLEAAVPAAVAILGGALIAAAALDWYQAALEAYGGGRSPVWQLFRFEPPYLAVLSAGAVLSTVAVSLVAGLPQLRRGPGESLRDGRGTTATRFRLGKALVAVEIGAGGALLLLASLMIRSAWNLHTQEWGFARETVMTGHLTLDSARYPSVEDRLAFWRALEAELTEVPGVRAATLATQLPMIRYAGLWGARRRIEVEGWEVPDREALPSHYADAVAPSFFETFETPLVAGRGFTTGDEPSSEPVAVVNTHFARAYFPDGSPVGRRLRLWRDGEPGPWRTVVGVAPHLWMDTDENVEPEGVYVPLAQAAPPEASMAVRVDAEPAAYAEALRATVWGLDRSLPVNDLMTMPELIRWRTRLYRTDGPPFIWLGLTALLLAVVGLYAVISYIASLRTREFGVRAALGASSANLVARTVLEGVPAILVGIAGGVATGLWLTRGFSRFMFDVDPWSPSMVAASYAVLVLAALAASLLPARRAARLDLVRVLGTE